MSSIHSVLTPLQTKDLELSFINNLKFLNITEKGFNNIIANKKMGWRYRNKYLMYFSSYTYQANSLITYKNSQNFKSEVLRYIKNSSPLYTQQLVIPKEETIKLIDLFNNTNNLIFESPDIIVLEKNSLIKKYSRINLDNYCKLKNIKYLEIYLSSKKVKCHLL